MAQVFLDALKDTAIVLPFLFVIYMAIEAIEHNTGISSNGKILQGGWAPLIGSAVGLVPLCGFSVMAANLYDKRLIKAGTLLSVFIATSDEAVIILFSGFSVHAVQAVLLLLAIKLVLAVAAGYAANGIISALSKKPSAQVYTFTPPAHEEGEEGPTKVKTYVLVPLWRSLKIALYLFLVNLAFGLIIYFVGEDAITRSLAVGKFLQPLIASAVGLIPSCASSVLIADAYLHGIITFGSMLAGLTVNAGLGFMVLLKSPSRWRQNTAIILSAFIISYLAGILLNALPIPGV